MRAVSGLVGLVAVLCLAVAAPSATAGQVNYVEISSPFGSTTAAVSYHALPLERNRVDVSLSGSVLTILDHGNLVIPDPTSEGSLSHCEYGLGKATCTIPSGNLFALALYLAGGDDRATSHVAGTHTVLAGDDGDDTLVLAAGPGVLAGGPGDDDLRGGPSGDELFGGPGSDELSGGGGGDGLLWMHYLLSAYSTGWASHDATAGVSVTLDGVANDGQSGEHDLVHGDIEGFAGTVHDDTFVGDDDGESFAPQAGDDVVDGRGGDDSMVGFDGSDDLTGGPGRDTVFGVSTSSNFPASPPDDDVLHLRDGEADRYACGIGADTVEADGLDVYGYLFGPPVAGDCESVIF